MLTLQEDRDSVSKQRPAVSTHISESHGNAAEVAEEARVWRKDLDERELCPVHVAGRDWDEAHEGGDAGMAFRVVEYDFESKEDTGESDRTRVVWGWVAAQRT